MGKFFKKVKELWGNKQFRFSLIVIVGMIIFLILQLTDVI